MKGSNSTVDMKEELNILPMLADKFTVDFVNGIHIINNHISPQQQQTSYTARLKGALTGESATRQTKINANLTKGVESSLKWLTELSESLTQSNYAILCINGRLEELTQASAKIANYSADTREQLITVSTHFNERCNLIENEIARIDIIQRAQLNLERVFNKWNAGDYDSLSFAGRCYVVLEELRWGAFGDYQRANTNIATKQEFVDDLKKRLIAQLRNDSQFERYRRLDIRDWLNNPSEQSNTLHDGLAYLGSASNSVQHPFIYSITQKPKQLPLRLPRISSMDRLSDALLNETF